MLTIRLRFRSSNLCSICLTADYANNADSLVVAAFVSNAHGIKPASLAASASLTVHEIGAICGSMRFNAIDIHTAFRNIRDSAHEFCPNAPALWRASGDMVETMSILPLRRTNIWPKGRRSHAIQVARKALTR